MAADTYVVEDCDGVADFLAAYFEHHAEREQVARLTGDTDKEKAHHWAVVLLVRAMTAEGVPS